MSRNKTQTFFDAFYLSGKDSVTESSRLLYTPSFFAKSTLFYLQEIGCLKSLKSHKSQRNFLDSFLYLSVKEGQGTLTLEQKTYHLSAGDHMLIDCRKPYVHESDSAHPWELLWIHFNGRDMNRYFMYFLKKFGTPLFHPAAPEQYASLWESLFQQAQNHSMDSELAISNMLNTLLTKILTMDKPKDTSVEGGADKLEAIRQYLDSHFQEKITLDSLAAAFFISKYHMSRQFKVRYGITIINYLNHLRINHAKGLLRFSDLQIAQICLKCGFEDPNYFNKRFRHIEGVGPSQYRKSWRGR